MFQKVFKNIGIEPTTYKFVIKMIEFALKAEHDSERSYHTSMQVLCKIIIKVGAQAHWMQRVANV